MIQDSKILKWFKKQTKKNSNYNWVVLMLTQPSLYLYTLLKKTLVMGLVLLVFYEIINSFHFKEQPIPSTLHSVLGLVLGLLLVFRTNTAYDRWWEARKIFSSFHSSIIYLKLKINKFNHDNEVLSALSILNKNLFSYIVSDTESKHRKKEFIASYTKLSNLIHEEIIDGPVLGNIERKMMDIADNFAALERIKDTPIPTSYSLHIKISVFAYLLTLPLGLFYGMGILSIPMVMVLFFIISGIEIISNEIENPFKGDPNDLPINDFKKQNEEVISNEFERS